MTGVIATIGSPARSEHSPLLAKPSSSVAGAVSGNSRAVEDLEATKTSFTIVGEHHWKKMDSPRFVASTSYGTLPLNQAEEASSSVVGIKKRFSGLLEMEPEADVEASLVNNNQSETESDSDGSCGSSMTQPPVIQSILRIRPSDLSCRTLEKKNSSVEFAIEINVDTDDEDDEYEDDDKMLKARMASARRKAGCASRCYPRRLTLEEKAELYRVRPDLELTPMPILLRDLEENRRRRQRKLVFSMLGGMLMLLMMIVMYYVFSQV